MTEYVFFYKNSRIFQSLFSVSNLVLDVCTPAGVAIDEKNFLDEIQMAKVSPWWRVVIWWT